MSDWPSSPYPNPPTITPWSEEALARHNAAQILTGVNGIGTAATVPTTPIFVPFAIQQPFTVRAIGVLAGTTSTGDWEVGLYDIHGNRLVTTGTVTPTAAVYNEYSVTPFTILPGRYFLAYVAVAGTVTARAHTGVTGQVLSGWGVRQHSSATASLPNPASFVPTASNLLAGVSITQITGL